VVERGACTGTLASGDNACGVFQIDVVLEPGERRELLVLLGVGRAAVRRPRGLGGRCTVQRRRGPPSRRCARTGNDRLGALVVESPDSDFDSSDQRLERVTIAW
jgi:cellobiose phosphorylase